MQNGLEGKGALNMLTKQKVMGTKRGLIKSVTDWNGFKRLNTGWGGKQCNNIVTA